MVERILLSKRLQLASTLAFIYGSGRVVIGLAFESPVTTLGLVALCAGALALVGIFLALRRDRLPHSQDAMAHRLDEWNQGFSGCLNRHGFTRDPERRSDTPIQVARDCYYENRRGELLGLLRHSDRKGWTNKGEWVDICASPQTVDELYAVTNFLHDRFIKPWRDRQGQQPSDPKPSLRARILVHASQADDIAERASEISGPQARLERMAGEHWHQRSFDLLAGNVSDADLEYYATDPPVDISWNPLMLFTGATPGHLRAVVLLRERVERLREVARRLD